MRPDENSVPQADRVQPAFVGSQPQLASNVSRSRMPTVPLCGLKSCRHVEYNAGPNPPAERLRIPRPSAGLFVRGRMPTVPLCRVKSRHHVD